MRGWTWLTILRLSVLGVFAHSLMDSGQLGSATGPKIQEGPCLELKTMRRVR